MRQSTPPITFHVDCNICKRTQDTGFILKVWHRILKIKKSIYDSAIDIRRILYEEI